MMKKKIHLDDLHKVESSSVIPLVYSASDVIQAIIKVNEADYVPSNVGLRAKISSDIFTGEFKYDDLAVLERDPKVDSVSISKKLNSA